MTFSFRRISSSSLSCEKRLRRIFVGNVQRGVLLNLSGLHGYIRDVKAGIMLDPKRIKLRRIESSRDSIECTCQGLVNSTLFCRSEASPGTSPLHPNEMPTRTSNHRVESGCFDLFDLSPVLTERHSRRLNALRQYATSAQENTMRRHACWPLGVGGFRGSLSESLISGASPGDLSSMAPAALGSFSGR